MVDDDREREARHRALRDAEERAATLFETVTARGILRPGARESQINEAIYELARGEFGVEKHWHKRIVRSGRNTLCPYRENPPDLMVLDDDIVFLDLGPVFAEWEADYGRTYVLGDDPAKLRLRDAVDECWALGRAFYREHEGITGAGLFEYVASLARERGYAYGQEHCGHLVGEFPHERLQGDERRNYIHPANTVPMNAPDTAGRPREWILEMHFVDRERGFGAFVERLLTVD